MYLRTGLLLTACLYIMFVPSSCVSNNEEDLYACDTTMVTYSATIAPIIEQNCYACHLGDDPISGIPLDGYSNLKTMVDAERLVGALRHLNGYSAMPKDAASLPECELLKIEKWVDDGAQDN